MVADFKGKYETLSKIYNLASSLSEQLNDLVPARVSPHDQGFKIPPLILPFPNDALKPLSSLPITDTTLQDLLECFNTRIIELQQQYLNTYQRACYVAAQNVTFSEDLLKLHQVYENLYFKEGIPTIESWVLLAVEKVAERRHSTSGPRQSFNNEYTPIFEKYFHYNGYPSASHRSILARKSGMTERQIEVWFQNHRRRARKDGRYVPRLDTDDPLRLAFELMKESGYNRHHHLPTLSYEDPSNAGKGENIPSIDVSASAPSFQEAKHDSRTFLDDSYKYRPPHSYPATKQARYPDPFPNDDGVFRFPAPTWTRTPATAPVVSVAVDMDEFIQMFHLKLNFSENSRRRGTTPSKHESTPSQPWFIATITFPSPAPLPALIRKLHASRPAPPSLDTFVAKPTIGSITSIAPLPVPPGEAPARKMRSLPRRIPTKSSSRPYGFQKWSSSSDTSSSSSSFGSRITSFGSDTSSSSFGSRTSSFSSDTSSGSGASSSSSNYSSSPELSTPPSLPTMDLPVLHDEAQEQNLFDFSHTELDPFSTFFPSSQNFDFAYTNPPSSNKVPDQPYFEFSSADFTQNLGIFS